MPASLTTAGTGACPGAPPVVPGVPSPATTLDWNKDRQLTAINRPDGAAVTFGYDGAGRLATVTQPRGTNVLSYGSTGMLASVTSPDTVTLAYNYLGPLVTRQEWSGKVVGSVEHTYNAELACSTQVVNGGPPASFGYDNDGLITSAGIGTGALTIHRRADNGLVDSTSAFTLGLSSSADYTTSGEPANLRFAHGDTVLFLESLAYDVAGRVVVRSETAAGLTSTYGYRYDAAGRLYAVTTGGDTTARYLYDANGNRVSFQNPQSGDTATATCDDQDRLLRYGAASYIYTAAGELSLKVAGSDSTRYTYDLLGNLITVALSNHTRIDYVIDGQNRRVGRKVNGALVQGWLYEDGLRPVAELDGAGSVVARYVWGSRGNVPECVVKGGTSYRIVADHLGSVRLVVNGSNGTVAERLSYDAYGRVTGDTSPGFLTLGYAGGITDLTTGLVRFGARDYDPAVGRWTCRDPIGFAGGSTNLWSYVLENPVGLVDPTGTDVQSDIDSNAGAADALTCGWASRLRDRWFPYHAISKKSAAYRRGVSEGRDIGFALAFGFGRKLAAAAAEEILALRAAQGAGTVFGRSVQSLKETLSSGRGPWQQVSAHAEQAIAKSYRGGTSIEQVFVNPQSGERIIRHTIVRGEDTLHETFRPYAKFGLE